MENAMPVIEKDLKPFVCESSFNDDVGGSVTIHVES